MSALRTGRGLCAVPAGWLKVMVTRRLNWRLASRLWLAPHGAGAPDGSTSRAGTSAQTPAARDQTTRRSPGPHGRHAHRRPPAPRLSLTHERSGPGDPRASPATVGRRAGIISLVTGGTGNTGGRIATRLAELGARTGDDRRAGDRRRSRRPPCRSASSTARWRLRPIRGPHVVAPCSTLKCSPTGRDSRTAH